MISIYAVEYNYLRSSKILTARPRKGSASFYFTLTVSRPAHRIALVKNTINSD